MFNVNFETKRAHLKSLKERQWNHLNHWKMAILSYEIDFMKVWDNCEVWTALIVISATRASERSYWGLSVDVAVIGMVTGDEALAKHSQTTDIAFHMVTWILGTESTFQWQIVISKFGIIAKWLGSNRFKPLRLYLSSFLTCQLFGVVISLIPELNCILPLTRDPSDRLHHNSAKKFTTLVPTTLHVFYQTFHFV